jgi:hypothetical protein
MTIEMGFEYKNKWGDKRIPVFIEDDYVYFVESSGGVVWIYNPYYAKCRPAVFKTWSISTEEKLDEHKLWLLRKEMEEIDKLYTELLKMSLYHITEVIEK